MSTERVHDTILQPTLLASKCMDSTKSGSMDHYQFDTLFIANLLVVLFLLLGACVGFYIFIFRIMMMGENTKTMVGQYILMQGCLIFTALGLFELFQEVKTYHKDDDPDFV